MNGATALPSVSTISPAKTASMTTIGSSQYFFRNRRKSQSSRSTGIMDSSELLAHRVRGRSRRPAVDPVGGGRAVDPEPEQVLAQQPQHQGHRRDRTVEQQRHDGKRDEPLQEQAQPEPEAVERAQQPGPETGHDQKEGRED